MVTVRSTTSPFLTALAISSAGAASARAGINRAADASKDGASRLDLALCIISLLVAPAASGPRAGREAITGRQVVEAGVVPGNHRARLRRQREPVDPARHQSIAPV